MKKFNSLVNEFVVVNEQEVAPPADPAAAPPAPPAPAPPGAG